LGRVIRMFDTLYSNYDYNFLPRTLGTPSQWEIFNLNSIDKLREKYSGKLPLYISHNQHHKNMVFYRMMMFDFDGEEEEVRDDVLNFIDYFKEYKKLINYTGNGIHIFIRVNPIFVLSSDLKVKRFQVELKQKLNLKTLDVSTIEPKKLTRLLLARYVKKIGGVYIKSLRHTIPVREKDLYDLEDVKEMSLQCNFTHINMQYGKLLDVSNLVEKDKVLSINQLFSTINLDLLSDDDFLILARLILNSSTNLFEGLMKNSPPDIIRFRSVIAMKSFGLDEESAFQFILRLSKLANWTDRNPNIIRLKVHQIYSKPYF